MASAPADDFVAVVRAALRHVHDHRRLDRIPLAPRGATATGRYGRALQAALREAISSLSPPSLGASLLRLRYLDGLAPPVVFRRLGLSHSEYYRQHDRCVADLADLLREGAGRPQPRSRRRRTPTQQRRRTG